MSLSAARPRICYDLAYVIVEKWLLSFVCEDSYKIDENNGDLGVDFWKIMMISRQYEGIFLRIFKQNFDECMFSLGLFNQKMHIYMIRSNNEKDSSLLFQHLPPKQVLYGSVRNKWIYAFLLVNNISLYDDRSSIKRNLLENKENCCSFDFAENPIESLLHFIYNGKDEFGKVIKAGVQANAIDKRLPRMLDCSSSRLRDPAPETINRLFNLSAERVYLSIDFLSDVSFFDVHQNLSLVPMVEDNRNKISTKIVELSVNVKKVDNEASRVLTSPNTLWKSVALYACDVCAHLELLYITIDCRCPAAKVQDLLHTNLIQMLDWFKQEALPKLSQEGYLEVLLFVFRINSHLLEFMREQNFSVTKNNGNRLHLSYDADLRFMLKCYVGNANDGYFTGESSSDDDEGDSTEESSSDDDDDEGDSTEESSSDLGD